MTSEKGVGQVPEGTVDEIKEWVGDDPRRAKKALKEENKSDSPRSTLVTALEALIPEKDQDGDDEGVPAEAEESEEGASEEAEEDEEDDDPEADDEDDEDVPELNEEDDADPDDDSEYQEPDEMQDKEADQESAAEPDEEGKT